MSLCSLQYLIGTPNRIGALDSALKYICGHEDVWKATGTEIVDAYLKSKSEV
jgi:hypothetical protein